MRNCRASFARVRIASPAKKVFVPVRDFASLGNISEILERLVGLDDYDVLWSGQDPAKLPPFTLHTAKESEETEFKGRYNYEGSCHLRAEVVSTCEERPFGGPCPSEKREKRDAVFRHPNTCATINVTGAACARFWIEFRFGKWLLPRIGRSLNLLELSMLANAIERFGAGFA